MPELPEVETIRKGLANKILNKSIISVVIKKPHLVRNKVKDFQKFLQNNKIIAIDRIGKLLIFELADQNYLIIHLKMTGQLIYVWSQNYLAGGHNWPPVGDLPNKYSHVIFNFADKSQLFFNDLRQFGYLEIINNNKLKKIIKQYGIEPGTKDFTWQNWQELFKNKKSILKPFLLNQYKISGIGNIYADEICFRAKVKPNRKINTLNLKELKKLYQAIQYIIKKAISKNGTTFSNYRDASNKEGGFKKYLKVYGRQDKPCLVCKDIIKKVKLGGRGTHYCSHCQK